jgi:hypothetical protein
MKSQAIPQGLLRELLVDDHRAAEILAMAPWFLRRERIHGRGPRFVRIGRNRVRYRIGDLLDYIQRGLVETRR